MQNLEHYLDKFSESGQRILLSAYNETCRRNHNFISPEYILYALMVEESEIFDTTMRNLLIPPQDIRLAVEERLQNSWHHTGAGFRISPETTNVFKYSIDNARSQGRQTIEASDICFVFATFKYNLLADILQNQKGSASPF